MLYTINEHDKQVETIYQLKREIESLRAENKKEISKITRAAKEEVEKAKKITQKKINDISNRLDEARQQTKQLENMNTNLIRIAKERANATRKIKPKKEHNGYILLNADQSNFLYKEKINRQIQTFNLPCWRIRLQTPFIISLDLETVKKLVIDDWEQGKTIHVPQFYQNGTIEKIDEYSKIQELWKRPKNFIFKTTLKINAIKGFWEVEYTTRDMIKITDNILIPLN